MKTISDTKRIALVLPSLHAGGMERVMSHIANYLALKDDLEIYLILLIRSEKFYEIVNGVKIVEPNFDTSSNFFGKLRILRYLRGKLREIKPYSILSFGNMYNSFVMLANIGLKNKIYLSDRCSPYRNSVKSLYNKNEYISDGIVHFLLKKILYRFSTGIIVQTKFAKRIEKKQLNHSNIKVIPNPVFKKNKDENSYKREKIILNVGRLIKTKQQVELIQMFSKIEKKDWKLVFLGDGQELSRAKKVVEDLQLEEYVLFKGKVSNVSDFYNKAEIFAFTSSSEGFPNALAEALITPVASIAFDCIAGPADLIKDGFNGSLIPLNNFDLYQRKLEELMLNEKLRDEYRANSLEKMKQFDAEFVLEKFYKTLTL